MRLRKLGPFTDQQVERGIKVVLGDKPANTPSLRILRRVGSRLAELRDSHLPIDDLVRSAVRSLTLNNESATKQYETYVSVTHGIIAQLNAPRPVRPCYDAHPEPRPHPNMRLPITA